MIIDFKPQVLSDAEKHAIKTALKELWFGLARANTLDGIPMGVARQKAMAQVVSFVTGMTNSNPRNATLAYMQRALMENRGDWSKMIMNSKKSSQPVELPKDKINETQAWGARGVQEALVKLKTAVKSDTRAAPEQTAPMADVTPTPKQESATVQNHEPQIVKIKVPLVILWKKQMLEKQRAA